MRRLSLKSKLILALSSILLCAFVVTNLINYRVSRQSLRRGIIEQCLPLTSDNIYSHIQNDLLKPVYVSSLMANDTFLKEWAANGERDMSKVTRYLLEIKDKYGFFSTFFVSDRTGNYYHFNGILKKISPQNDHDVWFYDFKRQAGDYDLSVDTNEASNNTLTIFINHRLNGLDGSLLGVTGVGLNMATIAELLDSYRERYDRNIYLVDRAGTVKVHRNQDRVDTANIYHEPGIGQIAARILSAGSEPGFFEYKGPQGNILLTSRHIPEFDWYLLVEQEENAAMAGIRNNFIRNLAFGFLVTLLIISINIYTVNRFQNKLEQLATTDELTGAYNRRELERGFERAIHLANRQQIPFSLVLFDLDGFKQMNDARGHILGDHILKEVATLALKCSRKNDLLVRWGGDEFVLLCPGNLAEAERVAERIRKLVREADLPKGREAGHPAVLTISCGVVQFDGSESLDSILHRADQALYQAKNQGRNRTVAIPSLRRPVNCPEGG